MFMFRPLLFIMNVYMRLFWSAMPYKTLHKITKKWSLPVRTGLNPFHLSVRTHHKFQKIRRFLHQKYVHPHMKNLLLDVQH